MCEEEKGYAPVRATQAADNEGDGHDRGKEDEEMEEVGRQPVCPEKPEAASKPWGLV